MIPALVLTAGLATRLRPLSLVRAKAAMPVAGEPLVRRILRQLRAAGVEDAVLNLHHLPYTIARQIGDGSDLGLRVRYSWEVPILGSAGGPRHALRLLGAPTFLLVNGDTLTDVDLAAAAEAHGRSGARVTLAVVPRSSPDKYGGVLVQKDGVVTGFTRRGSPEPSYHFVGVQVLEADAFASLPPATPAESIASLYPALIATQPGSVRAHVCRAEFFDIGTPADYLRTSLALAARDPGSTLRGARTHVRAGARVDASILWDDVEVESGATLTECVVADGACVPAGTVWTRATIRRAEGDLAPGERRLGELATGPIA